MNWYKHLNCVLFLFKTSPHVTVLNAYILRVKSVSLFLYGDTYLARTQSLILLISPKMLHNAEPSLFSSLCCPPSNQPISTRSQSWTPTDFAQRPIREPLQPDAILSVYNSCGWGYPASRWLEPVAPQFRVVQWTGELSHRLRLHSN